MPTSISNIFTANRVTALGSFAVSLGALISAFVGVFPSGWQNAALAAAGLLAHAPIAFKFLDGAQKSEALQARTQLALTTGLPNDTQIMDMINTSDPNYPPASSTVPVLDTGTGSGGGSGATSSMTPPPGSGVK